MAWNQYSRPREAVDLYTPISDEMMTMGAQTLYGRAQQNANNISSQFSQLFGVQAYGKDAEVIGQLENTARQQIQELAKGGLDNPENNSRINSLISQYTNHPDVQAISQRSNFYQNELRNQEKAAEKGQIYISPTIDSLNEYFSQGNYYRKPEGVALAKGFNSPNLNKAKQEIIKNAPRIKTNVRQGNYWVSKESPDMDFVEQQYNDLYNQPDVRRTLEYNFNKMYKDADWESQGYAELQDGLSKAQFALSINPNDEKARAFVETNGQLLNNPQRLGEIAKNRAFQAELERTKQEDIIAANYESFGNMEADVFVKDALDFQQQKQLALYKAQLDKQTGTGETIDKEVYKAAIASGTPIYDASGNLIPVNQLSYNPQESRDNVTSTKKEEVANIPTKLKNVFENIEGGIGVDEDNKKVLTSYIQNNRDLLESSGSDVIKNINYSVEDGLKTITWEIDDWGTNTKKKAYVVTTQEEYDKLPSGSIFIDSTRKPAKKK